MSVVKLDALSLYYRLDGPEDAPVLVLSHSLGVALEMWQPQISVLSTCFRVLRYDMRGHGRSGLTPGPYSIERLGCDVIGLLDALEISKVHFCGLSLGGMIGIWLGIHAADRLERLVLCNTAAQLGTPDIWNERIAKINAGGMNAIVGDVISRWFTPAFRAREPAVCTAIQAMLNTTAPAGYTACCAAIRDMDLNADLGGIPRPTLVISGSQDPVTPPEIMQDLAEGIPGAKLCLLEAAHLSNIEAADRFTSEVLAFLEGPTA